MQDGKHVVLCIDDDSDIRDSLRVILESSGYVFSEASTAEEGLQVFRTTQPDIVIVDLMMEEVDAGTNFVKEIRLLGAHVPIIMLSSVGDSLSGMIDTSQLGLSGVLQKPIAAPALRKLLAERLGKKD
ncbi:MAG: response regulator [Polyangiaceae bacterium]|nr:response regulator [Polyangiaceae bacterium]